MDEFTLDYSGNEKVNFKNMKWSYTQNDHIDKRDLRRVGFEKWEITDDHGNWVSFSEDYDDNFPCKQVEHLYQEWRAL